MPLTKEQIAQRISKEIKNGFTVNLGIGIPTLVANYIKPEQSVFLQSENGLLGIGAFPTEDKIDADLINAGKQTVTSTPGASYFSSADSFAMIRGGHIDLSVLGAMQVDEKGDIANWMIPNKMIKGMGGAMDLVAGSKNVIVAMQHTDRKGNPKILKKCNLPLTGLNCINKIVSDLAVMNITSTGIIVTEIIEGMSFDELQNLTEAKLTPAKNILFIKHD